MKIVLALVVALLSASVASAQTVGVGYDDLVPQAVKASTPDRVFLIALGSYDVLGASDIATKMFLIGQGAGREIGFAPFNPTTHPTAFAATKLSLMALTNYLLIAKIHPTHPTLARWIAIGAAGLETSLVVRNTRLQR